MIPPVNSGVPVPASARLLEKLKETWGEELTQDLVTWVSEAQTVSRVEFRELADQYFARLADQLDERIARRLDERIALSEARLDTKLANLRADVISQMRDQMKWMFAFWIGTLVPLAGLIVALGKDWL
jgi:hypothetical protein